MIRQRIIQTAAAAFVLFTLLALQCPGNNPTPTPAQDVPEATGEEATGEEGPRDLLAEQGWDLKLDTGWAHDIGFSYLCWFINTDPAPGAPYEVRATGTGLDEAPVQTGNLDSKGEAAGKYKIKSYGKYTLSAKATYQGNEQAASDAPEVVEGPGPKSC